MRISDLEKLTYLSPYLASLLTMTVAISTSIAFATTSLPLFNCPNIVLRVLEVMLHPTATTSKKPLLPLLSFIDDIEVTMFTISTICMPVE